MYVVHRYMIILSYDLH